MRDYPIEEAERLYLKRFWFAPGFDKVYTRCPEVAEEIFDGGVLSSPARSSEWLQTALTKFNLRGRIYPDLEPDGVIGSITLKALDAYLDYRRNQEGVTILLRAINCLQGHFLLVDATNYREENEDFVYGWFAKRIVL